MSGHSHCGSLTFSPNGGFINLFILFFNAKVNKILSLIFSFKQRVFNSRPQSTYDYGRQLLQATVVLCQSLRCATRSSGDTLPRLNRVWKQFTITADERQHRLETARDFHAAAERVGLATVESRARAV